MRRKVDLMSDSSVMMQAKQALYLRLLFRQ